MEWQDVCSLVNSLEDESSLNLSMQEKDDLILALLRFFEGLPEGVRDEITREIKRFAWVPLEGDLFQWEYNSRSGRA